ncbi:MAG: hypothetical protein KAT65_12830 [Methanophagales archaeon]|nr:hypothetical protein [Methanophagales archaeon]
MCQIEFPYAEEESNTFGSVMRPRISMDLFSTFRDEWLPIDDVLADTGADLTVLPRFIGELLTVDITDGKYSEIKGVIPGTILVAYVHQIEVRIGTLVFEAPVAIADSNDVPSIFGRVNALDRFDANFLNGERVKLYWKE